MVGRAAMLLSPRSRSERSGYSPQPSTSCGFGAECSSQRRLPTLSLRSQASSKLSVTESVFSPITPNGPLSSEPLQLLFDIDGQRPAHRRAAGRGHGPHALKRVEGLDEDHALVGSELEGVERLDLLER